MRGTYNGYPKLSPHGMWRSPHKKIRGSRDVVLLVRNGVPARPNGDSGNVPLGKKKRNDRVKAGAPGTPMGICIEAKYPGLCRCGKHNAIKKG